jgi:FMN phosphatase YigB (HAD superfamily)
MAEAPQLRAPQPPARARACLIDVYDTILISRFEARMTAVVEPLGIPVGDWLAEFEKLREDRDRGKVTVADSYARTLRAIGVDPDPALVADMCRRDAEFSETYVRLCDDTLPFLKWLRGSGVRTALVSNCADTTRAQLERMGVTPLVDAVVLSCEVGSIKPEPEIYRRALGELGTAAADAVFIDDQAAFCAGAAAVGIRPVQILRAETGGGSGPGSGSGSGPGAGAPPERFPVIHSLFNASSMLDAHFDTAGPGRLPFGTLLVR